MEVLEETVREDRLSNQPTVLIAQSANDDGLFAIERVQEGIYAICKLGNWVTFNSLERLQAVPIDIVRPRKKQRQEQPGLPEDKWWCTAAIDLSSEIGYDRDNKSGIAKTYGVRLCFQTTQQKPIVPAQITQEIPQTVSKDQIGNVSTHMVEEAAQDPEEVFRMVRAQYQEALYASKVRHSCSTSIRHVC